MGKAFNYNYDKENPKQVYENKNIDKNCGVIEKRLSSNLSCRYKIEFKTIFENEYKNIKLVNGKIDNKMDFILKNKNIIKIYGYVEDENKKYVEGAVVILYKEIQRGYNVETIEVAEIITDCTGMFVFIEPYYCDNINYKVKLANI